MAGPASCTLVRGDQEFLVERALGEVIRAVRAQDPGCEVREVAAAELTAGEFAELVSPSLFGSGRVVVLRGVAEASKQLGAELVAWARSPVAGVFLVAVHPGGARGRALLDAWVGAGAAVVEVPGVRTNRDREQFVLDEVGAAGAVIQRDAVVELLAAVGSDLRELAMACAQLVADVAGVLDVDAVRGLHRGRAEVTGFVVADRAVEGAVGPALEQLRWALAIGVDPVLITSALAANLRTIAVVGGAGRGGPEAVARVVGLPPWKVRRAQTWLRGWRPEDLAVAVRAVAGADGAVKGAADDPGYAVERAVIAVAAARSR